MNIEVALLVIAVAVAVIGAIGAWRRRDPAVDRTQDVLDGLEASERRLSEALDRARSETSGGFRDQTFKLTEQVGQVGKQLADSTTSSSHATQGILSNLLETSRRSQEERLDRVETALRDFIAAHNKAIGDVASSVKDAMGLIAEAQAKAAAGLKDGVWNTLTEMQAGITRSLSTMSEVQVGAITEVQASVQGKLDEVRKDNEARLEMIRSAVDEKLQSTLETRLGESFKLVSERLEQVYKGLGEMQTLAVGVGDLKRVLTNVRSRGTYGEVQLEALLEQVLNPEQYVKNVATVPGSKERVEFAIRLPGRDDDGGSVLLPIDAKFPQEDFLRLQQAYEDGDVEAVETWRSNLRKRVLLDGETIHDKYVCPPQTTDFALLFLPTEGLYAEVLRLAGVSEELQTRFHVVVTGPTTLWALLNSLQMGFRTLAIEKRSSEVWRILGAVKTEFSKFGTSLEAVGKKLEEASTKISDASRRSRAVERKLREVEALPEGDAGPLLGALVENLDEPEG